MRLLAAVLRTRISTKWIDDIERARDQPSDTLAQRLSRSVAVRSVRDEFFSACRPKAQLLITELSRPPGSRSIPAYVLSNGRTVYALK